MISTSSGSSTLALFLTSLDCLSLVKNCVIKGDSLIALTPKMPFRYASNRHRRSCRKKEGNEYVEGRRKSVCFAWAEPLVVLHTQTSMNAGLVCDVNNLSFLGGSSQPDGSSVRGWRQKQEEHYKLVRAFVTAPRSQPRVYPLFLPQKLFLG